MLFGGDEQEKKSVNLGETSERQLAASQYSIVIPEEARCHGSD